MHIITQNVLKDEPCYGLFTGPRMMPGYDKNPRMVEFVFVVRDDAIAKFERDFGAYDDWGFYVPPMMIPSDGENTVAQLMDMGERHRHDQKWDKRMREYKESSTLFSDVIRQEQEQHEFITNRSIFGPSQTTFRNSPHFSPRTHRNYKDKLAEITKRRKFYTS